MGASFGLAFFSDVLVSLAPILIERPERIPEVIQVLVRFLLPDDPIALATLGESLEHRLRLRQLLDVHSARGDSVERRYLTKLWFDLETASGGGV